MKDRISVIVPTYNLEQYLSGCLDSLLAQTYTNLEIVVVDDGSKDCTAQVIAQYAAKDARIKPVYKENGGVTSARLCGVAQATGDWIGFVDGDDYIEPEMYARLLENAKKHDADISHCGYRMVFPSGRTDYYYNSGRVVLQDSLSGMKDLIEGAFVEPGLVNKLFRRELFKSILQEDKMDATIRNNEDLLMNYYLFREAKTAVFEDVCPYYYMLRTGSAATSQLNEHKLKDPLKVLDILFEENEDYPDVQAFVQRRRAQQMISMATLLPKSQKELILPYRREIRKRLRRELKPTLQNPYCSFKVKCMALWAAVWPWSYGAVHAVVSRLNGNAHKYDV